MDGFLRLSKMDENGWYMGGWAYWISSVFPLICSVCPSPPYSLPHNISLVDYIHRSYHPLASQWFQTIGSAGRRGKEESEVRVFIPLAASLWSQPKPATSPDQRVQFPSAGPLYTAVSASRFQKPLPPFTPSGSELVAAPPCYLFQASKLFLIILWHATQTLVNSPFILFVLLSLSTQYASWQNPDWYSWKVLRLNPKLWITSNITFWGCLHQEVFNNKQFSNQRQQIRGVTTKGEWQGLT